MRTRQRAAWVVGLIAVGAALVSTSASASTPIEFSKWAGTHCPATIGNPITSGGCYVHVEGESTLFAHIFGIESTEETCHVEFEGRFNESGVGAITKWLAHDGGHPDNNCPTSFLPSSTTLPWPAGKEEDAGNVTTLHVDWCLDHAELSACSGEFVFMVTEAGGAGSEAQHYSATDLRIGSSSLCEITIDVESETGGGMPGDPHIGVHIKTN